jgi:GDPmannose 4,6-dehydratase
MKALIFGANGQDGFYLNQLLLSKNIEVIGVARTNAHWQIGDVANYTFVKELIAQNQPDYIFHLAANSTTRHDALFENHETISTGSLNILESVYQHSKHSKVFLSGSGLQFVNIGLPIKETDEFYANSPYSIARIQSVYAARYYRTLGLKVYVGYFFNHDSPLRSERHVNQKIVQTLKRISQGSNETLKLFDINVKKEFGFASDIVKGIWTLINNNTVFEAVIGTGKAHSIAEWLDVCSNYVGIDWRKITTTQPNFKKEYEVLVSNPSIINSLGWQHNTSLESLAKTMFEYKYE